MGWIRGLFGRKQAEHALDTEVRQHIEWLTEDYKRSGMTREDARRAAELRFGAVSSVKERVRDENGTARVEALWQDLRYACRGMRKSPGFTTVVVLTLALGIGANTALFSLVEKVLLRQLPVRDPEQLYFLRNVGAKGSTGAPPYPCFELFRGQATAFEGMAAFVFQKLDVLIDGRAEQVSGELVSSSYFDLLGVRPALGRLLTAQDDQLQPPVAVISHAYWQSHFRGDPGVVGKVISYRQFQLTVVGVIEEGFVGMTPGWPIDVALPFTVYGPRILQDRANWGFDIVARLKPAISADQARAQIDPIFQNYMADLTNISQQRRTDYLDHMEVVPASQGMDMLRERFEKPLLVLLGLVGIVLVIGCANLASLLMARAGSRRREFAVRLAIGAGRGRLVRQLVTEILLLFGLGAAMGLAVAHWGSRLVASFLAVEQTPIVIDLHWNLPVLAFSALLAIFTGLVFGVVPILGSLRSEAYPGLQALGSRATDSPARMRVRQALVIAQVALSLVLLVGAGLLNGTLANLDDLDLGFRPRGVLTLSVAPVLSMTPNGPSYTDERMDVVWAELVERVRALPGIESASLSALTPLSGRDRGVLLDVPSGPERDPNIVQNHVSDEYFETFGIPLLAGRVFGPSDRTDSPKVAILNDAAAKFYLGSRNPTGARVQIRGGRTDELEVVGVVGDAKHLSLREDAARLIYIPVAQRREPLRRLTLALRTTGNPAALTSIVQRQVREIGSDILVSEVTTAEGRVAAALSQERLLSGISGFLAFLALILSGAGLFGLLAYLVQQRTAEIGIRAALGANASSLMWMIQRRSLSLVAIGIGVGIPAAWMAVSPLESLLYRIQATDMAVFGVCVLVLAVTSVLASYIPARRASSIDPMTALRNE